MNILTYGFDDHRKALFPPFHDMDFVFDNFWLDNIRMIHGKVIIGYFDHSQHLVKKFEILTKLITMIDQGASDAEIVYARLEME